MYQRWAHFLNQGDTRKAQGDLVGAQEYYQECLDMTRKNVVQNPKNADGQQGLSVSLGRMGEVQGAQGDFKGAKRSCQESVDIARTLTADDPKNAMFFWRASFKI